MIKLVAPNCSDLFEPSIQIGNFPDGDSHITIPNLEQCRKQEIIVYLRLYPEQNTNLAVLLFILDSLKSVGAEKITAVCPYLPYARQDKQKLPGELTLAYSLCHQLARAGVDKLVGFDIHFLNKIGEQEFAGLKIENYSMGPALIEKAKEIFNGESFEIIGPDDGSNYLVAGHGGQSMKKVRKEYAHGKVGYRDIHDITGELNVAGKNVLILDDMISSGSTMIKALEKVMAGGAKKVACAATHGLFLFDCLDKMRQFTHDIFCADTIIHSEASVSIKEQILKI
jgi:ribose-phosphate pyrophosphokinase